ncbi:class I SAM-dependent methyltransferase [Fusobacterium varium]|uniref:class I SAM-dependent methyltransferase n=1 Tax=Fusobacterium varium TaxID=856 RepID=UPI000E42B494|nr:class I SAM-dependent methyltransferase [Fusobacterium varium]MCI6033938.1 methyltransferase domain-containing protein [Fusobacterium varium]RGJ30655.1 class I SAM-dependent methyltransferase [Fusobacterium varium]
MKSFNKDWEKIHQDNVWGQYPSEDVIRFIARNFYSFNDRSKIKILDYGCGAGANTWYLSREGFDVYAFDGSISAVEKTKQKLNKDNLKAELIVADALEINYKNNFFDCIIDSAVIYANTVESIKRMYLNIFNILKSNGKLLTTGLFTTNTSGYGTGFFLEENTFKDVENGILKNRGTAHFFKKDEIYNILNMIGFVNIKIGTIKRIEDEVITEYFIVSAEKK